MNVIATIHRYRFLVLLASLMCICILAYSSAKSGLLALASLILLALLAILNLLLVRVSEKSREAVINRANGERENIERIVELIVSTGSTVDYANQLGNEILRMFGYQNLCLMVESENVFFDYYYGEDSDRLRLFKEDIVDKLFRWSIPKALQSSQSSPLTLKREDGDEYRIYDCAIIRPKSLSGGRKGYAALINYRQGEVYPKAEAELGRQLQAGMHPLYQIAWLLIEHILDFEKGYSIERAIRDQAAQAKSPEHGVQMVLENIKPLLNFSEADFTTDVSLQDEDFRPSTFLIIPLKGRRLSYGTVVLRRKSQPNFNLMDLRLAQRFFSLAITIYERELVEQQRTRQAEWLATTIRGLAHGMKKISQRIWETCDRIDPSLPNDAQRAIPVVQELSDQLNENFQRLFSATSDPEYQTFNFPVLVNAIVREKIRMNPRWKDAIEVYTDYGNVTEVTADPDKLQIALTDLIANACEAMNEEGGTLTIKAAGENDAICMEIRDTGIGIPEGHLEKVFELRYTTKRGGTGLGMWIAKQIIEEMHYGQLSIDSDQGIGTVVYVKLPKRQYPLEV